MPAGKSTPASSIAIAAARRSGVQRDRRRTRCRSWPPPVCRHPTSRMSRLECELVGRAVIEPARTTTDRARSRRLRDRRQRAAHLDRSDDAHGRREVLIDAGGRQHDTLHAGAGGDRSNRQIIGTVQLTRSHNEPFDRRTWNQTSQSRHLPELWVSNIGRPCVSTISTR